MLFPTGVQCKKISVESLVCYQVYKIRGTLLIPIIGMSVLVGSEFLSINVAYSIRVEANPRTLPTGILPTLNPTHRNFTHCELYPKNIAHNFRSSAQKKILLTAKAFFSTIYTHCPGHIFLKE